MISVGLFEAKTNLSALIEKVEAGEEIQITRHGKPVARIVEDTTAAIARRRKAAERINAIADKSTLGSLSWKELRDTGRK
jgi:prevent-host-death family protein